MHDGGPVNDGGPVHEVGPVHDLERVLADEAAARDQVWSRLRAEWQVPEAELIEFVLHDPAEHPWRTVDTALDRSRCPSCQSVLGSGQRGCRSCDNADGIRFLGREPDRPGVPPGNEHAVRVAVTVVRNPHRWPAEAVAGNRLYLPLFAAGDMPTKAERYVLLGALRAGRAGDLAGLPTFAAMAQQAATPRRLD